MSLTTKGKRARKRRTKGIVHESIAPASGHKYRIGDGFCVRVEE